ncbi:methyltransferase domain-containing protein [Candidatus Woesearchaeota archaeon]|nr:methyltransferase domain-containing protein [Candidatus Woesearchaeota archaeon]
MNSKNALEWHKKDDALKVARRKILLNICKGKRILDIGGGIGKTASYLSNKGYSVTVLEKNKEFIKYGKSKNKRVKFIQGNAYNLNFNETFDEVLIEEVIEHVKDQKRMVKEARKVLKKDGRIIISTPNKWVYRAWLAIGRLVYFRWNELFLHVPGHISEINTNELKNLLDEFKKVKIYGVNYFFDEVAKKHSSLGIGIVAVAQK